MKKTLAVALALALTATACGSSDEQDDKSEFAENGTFVYAIPADPGELDPANAVLGATNTVLAFAYDTLVYSDVDGKIVSGLAEKWEAQADKVTFTLRKGVTCADKSPVTPQTVADSMNYLSDPKNKAALLGVLIPAGMTATADEAAGTVTLATKDPNPFLLESMTAVYVVCGEGLKDRSILKDKTSGTGMYPLFTSVANDHYAFKARADYAWGPDGVRHEAGMPAAVQLKVVKDESTAANMMTTGELNGAQFTGADRKRVEAIPGVRRGSAPDGIGELFFHQGDGRAAAEGRVRRALVQAVDLDELRAIVSGGDPVPATRLISLAPDPCRGDSVTGNTPPADPGAAAVLLDETGWKAGTDGVRAKGGERLKLRVAYQTSAGPGVQAGMEYIAQKWKALGVETELVGSADAKYSDSLFKDGDWDMAWVPLGLSLPTQLVGYLSGPGPDAQGSNFAGIRNLGYEQLVDKAEKEVGTSGCGLWTQAEAALVENADVVPVLRPTQLVASKNATLEVIGGVVRPASVRLLKN